MLANAGLVHKTAVCSNLALDYAPAALSHIPLHIAEIMLSYEVGAVKPEPAIFRHLLDMLGMPAARVLFVGDSKKADIDGAAACGLQSMHIDEYQAVFLSGKR